MKKGMCFNTSLFVYALGLEYPFSRRQVILKRVFLYGHLYCLGEGLINGFYLMVLVLAPALYMQVALSRIGKRLEEMIEHFGRHIAYFLTAEVGIPNDPVTAPKIEQHF